MKRIKLYLLHFFFSIQIKTMILIALLPLIARAVPYILGGLDYLRRLLLPPAPITTTVGVPYTPPFPNGQCVNVFYIVTFKPVATEINGNVQNGFGVVSIRAKGAISSITGVFGADAYTMQFTVIGADGAVSLNSGTYYNAFAAGASIQLQNLQVVREDGGIECGSVPNPNPNPSIATDGIATSTPPNPSNFVPLITGIAAATAAAFLAAKAAAAAALAAAKAAAIGGNLADAIAKIADALAEILKLLAALEKKKDKEKDEEKTVSKYDFGRVEKDGFLRLYPNDNLAKQELSYLDIQVEDIPSYTGKYFGQLSPHYYRYKSLGYISFVSPTFGILETRQIDFRRLSLNPPENAFGFFYHFGLDGILKANLTGFYTKKEEETEPPAT